MKPKRDKPATPLRLWQERNDQIIACQRCPRLRAWCTLTAQTKRKSFADQPYWGKPAPNWGSPDARLLIIGLAPAAHGANRTGRLFTGDRSGDFLFTALHATGFASQPESRAIGDGLTLIDCAITAVAHCAPPDNKPLPAELHACAEHLAATLMLLPRLRVILCLGRIAQIETLRTLKSMGRIPSTLRPPFAHGAACALAPDLTLLSSFHPSQQNTFTGRLTQAMLQNVFAMAQRILADSSPVNHPTPDPAPHRAR